MKDKELEVLEQYNIDVKGTRRIRGAILCDTNQGLFLLKEMKFSEKRAPILCELYEHLLSRGCENIDTIVKNKEDGIFSVSEDEKKYILKKWFHGKECDNKKEMDIMESVRNLAILHCNMKKTFDTDIFARENLSDEFFRHNREMKKVRAFIREKVGKGEFETLYLTYFDQMFVWAEFAYKELKTSGYDKLLKQSREEGAIIHGDYNYHNILITPNGVATTNFERFGQGIQVSDFYYFLRKTMEKNNWNVELGNKMVENYNRIHPLSKEEMDYISLRLAYPEKFWKAANSYYRSSKAWLPAKSLEKLQLSIKQMEEKKKFLENIFILRL